jgi:4-amino-4-deoxy-L-arabinose transferase-like glycosyltransferase
MSTLAPGSLVGLRLPSTLSAALVVMLTGVIAAELGARRNGQVFAAACAALTGVVLATGHLLSTATTDLLGWTVITWLLVRLLRSGSPSGWLLFGLAAGITLLANVLVAFLLVAVLGGLLIAGPRQVLHSRWPWLGAAIAGALVTPYLIWQARHGWPQLDVARSIAHGGSGTSTPRLLFLPQQVLIVGPWLTPVWGVGLVRLLRDRTLRSLAVAYLLLCLVFLVAGGKSYYVAGLYPLLLAAGAQPLLDWLRRKWVAPALLVLSANVLLFALPVLPVRSAGPVITANWDVGETIAWPQYVAQIATLYHRQPPGTQILTSNYGEAGAIDRYGLNFDLPAAFSGQDGYAYWGPPPPGTRTILAIGMAPDVLDRAFTEVHPAGRLVNSLGINNDEQDTEMFVCSGPRDTWNRLWPSFAHF